jgi:multimeric flavodoxin WrbA
MEEFEMNFVAVNGSPRKNMNTAKLVNSAINGLDSLGIKAELYNLYDLNYKGCLSCFSCKKKNGKSYGRCAINDDLRPLFKEIEEADGLILGSPIYYKDVTGEMRSFLERLMFQYMLYTNPPTSLFKRRLRIGFIYTMNIDEKTFAESCLKQHLEKTEESLKMILGDVKTYHSFSTNQLENYDNIDYTYFNIADRLKISREIFPIEIEKVCDFGKSIGE